jgi:hypothetical protein
MRHLFAAGKRYVVLYSTNTTLPGTAPHVRHRRFSPWVDAECQQWRLMAAAPGPGVGPGRADFFVYERAAPGPVPDRLLASPLRITVIDTQRTGCSQGGYRAGRRYWADGSRFLCRKCERRT